MIRSVTKARVLVGVATGLAVVLVAALLWMDWNRICTATGCDDSVGYMIPDEAYVAWGAERRVPVVVETCIDEECQTAEVTVSWKGESRVDGGAVHFDDGTLDLDGRHTVRLKVTDPLGMVRYARADSGVTLSKAQPNGPGCAPTCAVWLLAIEPDELGV